MWKKVVAPTLLVCALWVFVSVTTTYGIYTLSRSHASILSDNVGSIRAAGLMQEALWRLQVALLHFLEDGEEETEPGFVELEAQFERSLVVAEQAVNSADERELVRTIRQRFSLYRDFIRRTMESEAADATARSAVGDRSTLMARNVAEKCTELVQLNELLMTESAARGAMLERTLYVVRLIFLIAGPGVGVYAGMRMARNLQTSISQICVTLKDASGELDQEVGRVELLPAGEDDLTGLNRQVQAISTRIRQVLSELQKARHDAVVAERRAVVGALAAGVAHELRNPLTSVKLLIQTAPHDKSGFQLQERQAHVILQEISRMEDTIQALLDFGRPPKLNRLPHDLRETVRRALNLVEGRAAHEGVAVISQLPAVALTVDGDPEQLHQVFVNLLINGIESMQPDGKLHVTAEASAEDPHRCRVVVADCGGGIPRERLGRIFEPFMTTKERGTGLGLAVSRRIVQEHGGAIVANNRPEGGTAFTVELPLVVSAVPAAVGPDSETASPRTQDDVAASRRSLHEPSHA